MVESSNEKMTDGQRVERLAEHAEPALNVFPAKINKDRMRVRRSTLQDGQGFVLERGG